MNDEKKTEVTWKIQIPPELLLDSINEVNDLVSGHTKVLNAVKALLHKYIKAGVSHNDAAAMALELSNRAANKANTLVAHFDEEKSNDVPNKSDAGEQCNE